MEDTLTVYIDILLITNGLVNSALLLMTFRFLGIKPRPADFFPAVLIATAYGLTVCIPQLSFTVTTLGKAVSAALISLTAFGREIKKRSGMRSLLCWGKCTCLFAAVSFGYAATVTTFQYAPFAHETIYINNGEIYYNIPVPWLLAALLILAAIQSLLLRVSSRRALLPDKVKAEIALCGRIAEVNLMCDTGNLVSDPISGLPAVFVDINAMRDILPPEALKAKNGTELFKALSLHSELSTKLALLPCRTAAGNSVCAALRPDRFTVDGISLKVIIALPMERLGGENETEGLVNPRILHPVR